MQQTRRPCSPQQSGASGNIERLRQTLSGMHARCSTDPTGVEGLCRVPGFCGKLRICLQDKEGIGFCSSRRESHSLHLALGLAVHPSALH